MRDFIAVFLATLSSAASPSDRLAWIKVASEGEDRRIDAMNASTLGQIRMAEMMREEKDWIISAAIKTVEEG
jgi:hypothetical protein